MLLTESRQGDVRENQRWVTDENGVEWRVVSQEEFDKAWADMDNRRIAYKVAKVFSRKFACLTEDDVQACLYWGLWKTLSRHKDGYGKKFTSSLHWWVDKEFRQALRFISRRDGRGSIKMVPITRDYEQSSPDDDSVSHLKARLSTLPEDDRKILLQVFVEGVHPERIAADTGYTVAGVQKRIAKAKEHLRIACRRHL